MRYTLLILILGICGCMSVPKATEYLQNKGALSRVCATAFPPDTFGFTRGQIIRIHDTTEVPGTTVDCPPARIDTVTGKPEIVRVKCPPSRIIHDSTLVHDTLQVIPSATKAMIAYDVKKIDSLGKELAIQTSRADSNQRWKTGTIWSLVGLGVLFAVGIVLKIKSVI